MTSAKAKSAKNFQKFVNFAKISQKIIFIYYRLGALWFG